MTEPALTAAELAELRTFDTPTVCNALELLAPERRALGFTHETMIWPQADRAPMVGYAKTALIRALERPVQDAAALRRGRVDYYRYVAEGNGPKIVVIQDLDSRRGFGCFWGEVNTAIHRGLGCEGVLSWAGTAACQSGSRSVSVVPPGPDAMSRSPRCTCAISRAE